MKAYSDDVRIRIFNYSATHSIRETARVFNVIPNTVNSLNKLFMETGSLSPRNYPTERSHLITREGEMYLTILLTMENDLTINELCDHYAQAYGIRVSIGTMYNTVKQLNFTRKKKTFSDPKKSTDRVEAKKAIYDKTLEKIEAEERFYLDETGSCINMSPLYGRSLQGTRVYDKRPTNKGTRINTIVILSTDGIIAHYDYTASFTAELFIGYLSTLVLPILTNDQTIIMDNHPVHHAKIVQKFLAENKIKYLYLPPYSPELNPIEEAFSKIKQYIKKQKARTVDSLLHVIQEACKTITPSDINGFFNHATEF